MARESRTQRVEGIVLKHADFGEADRMVTLFTLQEGKLRAVAKGARKLGSRKGGHLEPFTRVSLLLGKGREIPIVEQAEALELNTSLSSNLEALGYAAYVVELVDKFNGDHDENRGVYRLTRDTLQRLAGGQDLRLSVRFFEVKLLEHMGFRPQLQHCAHCGKKIEPEDQYFSFELGGALCPGCGKRLHAARISLGALKVLRHLQRSEFGQVGGLALSAPVQHELERLMNGYVAYLAERSLNTPRFLERVRRSSKTKPD